MINYLTVVFTRVPSFSCIVLLALRPPERQRLTRKPTTCLRPVAAASSLLFTCKFKDWKRYCLYSRRFIGVHDVLTAPPSFVYSDVWRRNALPLVIFWIMLMLTLALCAAFCALSFISATFFIHSACVYKTLNNSNELSLLYLKMFKCLRCELTSVVVFLLVRVHRHDVSLRLHP